MHFLLQTQSLQHIALVRIAAHLSSQRDVFTQIAQSFNAQPELLLDEDEKKWIKAMEDTVASKVCALPLPKRCIEQLLTFVKPLAMEILDWCLWCHDNMKRNNKCQFADMLLLSQLCWTMHGNVDYAKTAELIVKDERLDVKSRYELACINCLQDDARELFERMGEEGRREYVKMARNIWGEKQQPLIIYFTCTLSGHAGLLENIFLTYERDSINERLFVKTMSRGTRATCEYLFKKLNQREKEQVLVECVKDNYVLEKSPACNVLYYLSLMNTEQQDLMFRERTRDVLIFLLRWPLQSLFVEAAKRGWPLMGQRILRGFLWVDPFPNQVVHDFLIGDTDYSDVLLAITDKISQGFEYYSQLFWECWSLSSADSRQAHLSAGGLLEGLLRTKREEFVRLIRDEASSATILALSRQYPELRDVLLPGESESGDVVL